MGRSIQAASSLSKIFGLGNIQHAILRDAINQAFILKGFVLFCDIIFRHEIG
jgi:hypothetical protein